MLLALAICCALVGALALRPAQEAPVTAAGAQLPYAPHLLVVGYRGQSPATAIAEIERLTHIAVNRSTQPSPTPSELLLRLPARTSVRTAATEVARLPGIAYAVPDYVAHAAGAFYPNDTGRSGRSHGWESLQWNFLPRNGVNAPEAWANLIADHRPGARGVTIAVVDTGIAFRNWRTFKRSPDFAGTRFVDPCDLVLGNIRGGRCTDPYALDRESHGTFVAGTIAEATNNHYGLTGLAYGASIMPVRVLDSQGNGDSSTIAAGIRYAVQHGAQVINLSIEFSPGTTSGQIPDVAAAITYAHNHGAVVVGAAGNDEDNSVDYPAALPAVISVGATTSDRCLAVYSDVGRGLNLVAPGGGDDAASVPGSVCHPTRNLPDIYQMTFADAARPTAFGLPPGWFGTSMAAPVVSAAAAMVIASGVLGQHPTPLQVLDRLEATARPLGIGAPNNDYGYGLVDIGAATAKGGPLVPPTKPYSLAGAATGGTGIVRSLRGGRSDGLGAR
jgi:serine protease